MEPSLPTKKMVELLKLLEAKMKKEPIFKLGRRVVIRTNNGNSFMSRM